MSRVERLQEETGSPSSLWKQYIDRQKIIRRDGITNDLFCFYEGKDDCKFYNVKLGELGKQITHFECHSKSNVLKFRKLMKKKYGKLDDVVYFVDKDFDDKIRNKEYLKLMKKKDIYVTPYYSIENFYTIEKVFENILINEYRYSICSGEYKILKDKFIILKNKFHEYIKDINYWYATYRYFYIEGKIKDEVKLSKFNLSKYIDINLENNNIIIKDITGTNLLDDLKLELQSTPIDFHSKQLEIETLFTAFDADFRGKMELFFLSKLIDKINRDSNYNDFIINKNIISNIVQYTNRPFCLDKLVSSL